MRNEQRLHPIFGVVLAALFAAACLPPGGPTYRELAAYDSFATTMPGACDVGFAGGSDARSTIEGKFYAFATRLMLSGAEKQDVVAWHRSAFEGDGWTPIGYGRISLIDGFLTTYAWRRDDLVLGLGFPSYGATNKECAARGGTLYELTITYEPDTRSDGEPKVTGGRDNLAQSFAVANFPLRCPANRGSCSLDD